MPRPRRTPKLHVDLAGLLERAQQHQVHGGSSSHVFSQTSGDPVQNSRTRIERNRSRLKRSRQNSRRNTAIWTTAVYPISILQHLPVMRGMRQRRSYRSRSRRSQRAGAHKHSGGTTHTDSRTGMPADSTVAAAAVSAEVEMPCCATESPTAETQLQSASNKTDISSKQPSVEPIFTPPLSTVILHHNPLFDVEGKTQSGLIGKHMQMAAIDQAKSRWQIRREKTSKPQLVQPTVVEQKDALKKKSRTGVEQKTPAKQASGSELSSNASNSHTTLNSAGSSDKSKSDTEESQSYEESIVLTTASVGVNTTVMNLHKTGSQVKRKLERNASKAPLAVHNTTEPQQLKADESVGRVLQREDVFGAVTARGNFDTMRAK